MRCKSCEEAADIIAARAETGDIGAKTCLVNMGAYKNSMHRKWYNQIREEMSKCGIEIPALGDLGDDSTALRVVK